MRVRELLALILSLVMASTAVAQDPVQVASAGGMTIEDLHVTVSKSLVIDYPADINRISTSNPEIVDAVPATSREFLLHGKGHGSATVVVWAKNGMRTMYNVTVEHNLDPIKRMLKDTFPNETIGVVAGRDSITLVGVVSSKEVADRAVAIATPLAKTVVSNLQLPIAPISKQIVLKVRFAELDRTVAQSFGVNLVSTGAGNTIGSISTQQFSAPQVNSEGRLSISDALNIFAFRPDLNLAAFVKALQSQGTLQILAEPNLVTTNGKAASFLVGGEFPVPVLQGGSNAGAVTIQFREFGIRLSFDPLITENGTIKLYVKPEVSTIDLANAVTFSGFTIPALATRRMETNIELAAGQSFVIAGLIDDRVTENFNKIPGLANIPILGTLFRSRNESRSKSELIIIVTPEIATPINANEAKPEPAWMKPFMPQKHPGDKVGTDIVPGTGGATVPALPADRKQMNREYLGTTGPGKPVSAVTPDPAAPKPAVKTDADSKRNLLKFWGHKPAPKAAAASETTTATPAAPFQFTPRSLDSKPAETPAAESAPVQTPVQAPAPAAEAPQPVAAPSATPIEAAEAKPAETKAPEAKPIEAAPKPADAQPAAPQPVEAKPVAAVPPATGPAGRRIMSAGLTSLPIHMMSSPAPAGPNSAVASPAAGAQR